MYFCVAFSYTKWVAFCLWKQIWVDMHNDIVVFKFQEVQMKNPLSISIKSQIELHIYVWAKSKSGTVWTNFEIDCFKYKRRVATKFLEDEVKMFCLQQ